MSCPSTSSGFSSSTWWVQRPGYGSTACIIRGSSSFQPRPKETRTYFSGQPFSAGEMEAFYTILREEGIANIVRE